MSLPCHLTTITSISCIFLNTFLERQSPQDYHMLNEDGELWLAYEGLKQANRLPDFSEWGFFFLHLHLLFQLTVPLAMGLLQLQYFYCFNSQKRIQHKLYKLRFPQTQSPKLSTCQVLSFKKLRWHNSQYIIHKNTCTKIGCKYQNTRSSTAGKYLQPCIICVPLHQVSKLMFLTVFQPKEVQSFQ